MGTGIRLRHGTYWLPAGWVGRAAADCIIPALDGPHAAGVRERLEHIHLYPGAVASFEEATADEMRTLHDAATRARRICESAGPVGWNRGEAFPGFLAAFDELLAYIAADARLTGNGDSERGLPSSRPFEVTYFRPQSEGPLTPRVE